MAQPSTQELLDSGGPFYGYLYYPNGSGMWDARNGAMLTKTGSGAVTLEGGVYLADSPGGASATYYTLPTKLVLDNDYTLIWRARKNAGASDNAGMIFGSPADNSYIWMRDTQILERSLVLGSNSGVGTLSTYMLTRATGGTSRKLYKDGTFVAEATTFVGAFQLLNILHGLDAVATYGFNGDIEFLRIIPGVIPDATQRASLFSDPYQGLVAGAPTATGDLAAVSLFAPTATAAGGGPGNASGSLAAVALTPATGTASGAAGTIAITSPVNYRTYQRNTSNQASVTVTGTYTGTPTSIEYRFSGGSWATLVASPAGGTFSQAVTLSLGQGSLEVRFGNSTGVTAASTFVGVGDLFVVAGQSNHVGQATGVVAPVASAFTATQRTRSGSWIALREAAGDFANSFNGLSTDNASYFGALSNRLQAKGVPCLFTPRATGSTTIAQWQKGVTGLYSGAFDEAVAIGGHKALLFWQGESDASNGTTQATYEAALNQLINDWYADTGRGVFIIKIARWIPAADTIRAAQTAVIASNPNVVGWADGDVYTGGVHYTTTTDVNNVADAVYAGMLAAFYSVRCSVTLTTNGSTPAASQTGISWAWWDAAPPNLATAPVQSGTGATTDASGVFNVTLTSSTLNAGQTGTLLAIKSDGTAGSTANSAFCAPVVVS